MPGAPGGALEQTDERDECRSDKEVEYMTRIRFASASLSLSEALDRSNSRHSRKAHTGIQAIVPTQGLTYACTGIPPGGGGPFTERPRIPAWSGAVCDPDGGGGAW
jgi:hypothetical protein